MAGSMILGGAMSVTASAEDGLGFEDNAANQNVQEAVEPEVEQETLPVVQDDNSEQTTEHTVDIANFFRNKTSETTTTDVSEIDYYGDDYYDTDGNATLIKQEKIIYDSEEMQFIAFTTKDGNVFYILINYSAEGDEDNVFFLNKVDDFDLYSLLYAGNEGEEEKDPAEQAKKYADAATNGGVTADVSDRAEEATGETERAEEKATTKQPPSMNSNTLILVGVGILAVIGGAVLVLKKGKFGKKKNTGAEDFEEDYDDDYGSVTDEDDEV